MIPFCVVLPALFAFAPGKDVLQLPFFLFFWYFSYNAIARNKFLFALLAGCVFFLGLFFSLGMIVALVMVFACMGVEFLLRKLAGTAVNARSILKYSGGCVAGFSALAILFYVVLHYNTITCVTAVYSNHAHFYDYFPRTYSKWVFMNLVDFVIFLGLPLAALFVFSSAMQCRRLLKRDWGRISSCFWAFLIILILLDVSGKNLGEVGRLWLFLMPLVPLLVADGLKEKGLSPGAVYGLLAMQLVYGVIFRICFDVKSVSLWMSQGVDAFFR
jgi:hypothetical protein